LPAVRRAELSERITRYLLGLSEFAAARTLLAYLSFGSEYDTAELVAALLTEGKRLALPRVDRAMRGLQLFHVTEIETQTTAGTWGIREPVAERCSPIGREEVSLVLVPGVAFTPRGDRLGYGGGYYDRLLRDWPNRPPAIAAAFALQVVQDLPTSPNDVRIDFVVTEDGVLQPTP